VGWPPPSGWASAFPVRPAPRMSRFAEEVLGDGKRCRPSSAKQERALAQEHHEWCMRMWRRLDRNLSNSITREELDCEEFRSVVKAVLAPNTGACMGGPRYARAQMNMDQAVSFCLRKADLNANGSLSFDEFKAFMVVLRQPHLARFTANLIFALFDLNGDKRIDENEFREVYRFYLGRIPTEAQFKEEWNRLDDSATGFVTLEDYVEWLRTSPNPVFHQHAIPDPAEAGESEDMLAQSSGSFPSSPSKAMLAETSSSFQTSRSKASAASGWRPWHSQTHLCWEQRLQPSRAGPGGMRLSTEQSKHFASRKDRPERPTDSPAAMKSLIGHCLARSDAMAKRPRWNPYLAGANPNWINDSSNDNGQPRQHVTRRAYFSRPQSLPDLQRHYMTHTGFHDHRERIKQPELKKKSSVLSTDRLNEAPEDLCPSRSRPACTVGCMRDPVTRERKRWNDFWQSPPQLKSLYQASTIDYRHIGPPPRHLYADMYDDEV